MSRSHFHISIYAGKTDKQTKSSGSSTQPFFFFSCFPYSYTSSNSSHFCLYEVWNNASLGGHSSVQVIWIGREEIRTCSLEQDARNADASSIRITDLSRQSKLMWPINLNLQNMYTCSQSSQLSGLYRQWRRKQNFKKRFTSSEVSDKLNELLFGEVNCWQV